jgi:hypothetical protein
MGEKQRRTYQLMLQVCGQLWERPVRVAGLKDLEERVLEAICAVELHLPASEADVKLHNLLHLVKEVIPDYGESR